MRTTQPESIRSRVAAGSRADPQGRQCGLALPAVLFVLVLVSALVAGGYFVAEQQQRAAASGPQGNAAFYAAEAGLSVALSGLDSAVVNALEPGASIELASRALNGGDEYTVILTRLDAGGSGRTTYFVVRSTGRSRGPRGGRRQVARLLHGAAFDARCCDAALTARGPVEVVDGSMIDGDDAAPDRWVANGICSPTPGSPLPGLLSDDMSQVVLSPDSRVAGAPPIAATDEASVRVEVDRWLRELSGRADIYYSGDVTLNGVEPALDAQGGCARSLPSNWGAPGDPGHACFGYLPLIRVAGDLRIAGPGHGQGILLVEGDMAVEAEFEFYGVMVVAGRLSVSGAGIRLYGGALVGNAGQGTVRVGGESEIRVSRCAAERAAQGPKLYLPHPLAEFSWLEILD